MVFGQIMKLVAISDIHGEKKYFDAAAELIKAADMVVLCGDISKDGNRRSAEEVLACIERYSTRIIGVHGNWDRDEVRTCLEKRGYSLHARGRIVDGTGFFGVGGSCQTPMNTVSEYTEEEINEFLAAGYSQITGASRSILITHAPPHRVRDRTFIGLRGGSKAVRDFLETNKIDLCLTGHIHEAHGIEQLGACMVVNSGSFKKGRYSIIDIGSTLTIDQGKL